MFKKIILIFIASSLYAFPALAARTDCVSQMALADISGNSITTAVDYELHFYPSLTGGAELTTAVTGTTTPSNGVLSIPFDCTSVTSNAAIFMEYVINGETLSPRVEMVSNPFAAVAFSALNVPAGAISNDSITTSLIVDGTITSSDIASGAIATADLADNSVTLGTKTTGDYVGSIAVGTGISTTGASSGEGIAHTLTLDQTISPTWTGTHRFNGNVGIGKAPTVALDVSGNISVSGNITLGGIMRYQVQTLTIPDNGIIGSPTSTLTPTSSYVELNCQDSQGCNIILDETGAVQGQRLTVISTGTTINGDPVFSDTATVQETAGVVTLQTYDSVSFVYIGDRWVEVASSSNH